MSGGGHRNVSTRRGVVENHFFRPSPEQGVCLETSAPPYNSEWPSLSSGLRNAVLKWVPGAELVGLRRSWRDGSRARTLNPGLQAVEVEVHDRRGEQREHLAEDEATDNGDAERPAELGARARAEGQGQRAEQSGHGGHHDGAETQQTSLIDGFDAGLAALALGLYGEVDHEDGVFLHQADQQNDADERDDAEVRVDQPNGEQRADTRGRKSGKNGDGMDIALVQDSQDDIDGSKSGEDQQRLGRKGVLEGLRSALKRTVNRWWHSEGPLRRLNFFDGGSQGSAGLEIERQGNRRKDALVIDGERAARRLEMSERA